MGNWKEEAIAKYAELEAQKKVVIVTMLEDNDLKTARISVENAAAHLSAFEEAYIAKIGELNVEIENVRLALQKDWDIEDKTYKCEAGVATIRTTKSLCVLDRHSLMANLVNLNKLPESIRSWDLTLLRKLKDVDLIPDEQACYEERQNVVIRGTSK